MQKIKESDMYEPVKQLLLAHGFVVKGEVKDCDVAAVKGDDVWIVEMKLQFNMTLLFQAMDRLAITDFVFVAIPRPKRKNDRKFSSTRKVLEKLSLGLITVSLDSEFVSAEIILFPGGKKANKDNRYSRAVKTEIAGRLNDTSGGVNKKIINTAYRERCIKIACLLEARGAQKSKDLKNEGRILRDNHYGWFEKTTDGGFELSAAGKKFLFENGENKAVAYYRLKSDDMI